MASFSPIKHETVPLYVNSTASHVTTQTNSEMAVSVTLFTFVGGGGLLNLTLYSGV